MKRGRPAHPDVLTPREWEVLDLVREGLTNEQIAARLRLSESGARFHVSEILSKLGVSSREEAAAWQGTRSRSPGGVLSPVWATTQFSAITHSISKASGVVLASMAGVTLLVGSYAAVTSLPGGGGKGSAAAEAPKANEISCGALLTYQCIAGKEWQDFTTIAEAVAVASFEPAIPAYIPAGFKAVGVRHSRPEGTADFVRSEDFKRGCPGCDPRMSHNDQIGIYYRDENGKELVVIQGFPAYFPFHNGAPPDRTGTLRIGERDAQWVQGYPAQLPEDQTALYFEIGRVGIGWERSPDGTILTGSPMSYSITSNALSLEELVRIAESVSFD